MHTQEHEKIDEEMNSNTRESAVAQQPTPNRKRKAESEMFDEFVDVGGNAPGDTTYNGERDGDANRAHDRRRHCQDEGVQSPRYVRHKKP